MERAKAALAGLLHDIGKFYQRTHGDSKQTRPPAYATSHSDLHAHATWSAQFVQEYVPQPLVEAIRDAILHHHAPKDVASKLISAADLLAAGERQEGETVSPSQLLSIFCQVKFGEEEGPAKKYIPLRALEITEETLFPKEESPQEKRQEAYHSLWEAFIGEVQGLDTISDPLAYVENLYYLLQRYTWCIPAAFSQDTPDVSLFEHSRITAALAVCLSGQDEQTLDVLRKRQSTTEPIAYLVEGDISGVQKFIYTITSRGAAKGLRGRSFYLQLLNEAIARYVLRKMALPITNLLYAGGGHFYLLVPPEEIDKLAEVQRHLDDVLLAHHDGALYIAFGQAALTADDFLGESFEKRWREVGQQVSLSKRRRYANVARIFEPRGCGGNEKRECQVCHAERMDVKEELLAPDEEPVRKCGLCSSLEDLGQRLGRADMLFLGEGEPRRPQYQKRGYEADEDGAQQDRRGRWEDVLAELGISVGLLRETDNKDKGTEWIQHPLSSNLYRGTLLGFQRLPKRAAHTSVSEELRLEVVRGVRYTVNVTPRLGEKQVLTFDELTEASQGLKRLGVLRMDVDDLGYIFASGFRGTKATNAKLPHANLPRVTSLSMMFALYFEGWVGELCRQCNEASPEAKRQVYAIYSGGDDLFIVGSWDLLPKLAYVIAQDLNAFVAQNQNVHLSAGITLHPKKYPLYQAAEDAHDALEAAKELPGKNAFTFLEQTFPWERYEEIAEIREQLLRLQQNSPQVGRNLFRLLLRIYEEYRETKRRNAVGHEQIVYGPWMWHSAYQLTRLAERAKGCKKDIRALHDYLRQDNFRAIAIVGLAARWAEALTKPKSSEEEKERNITS